MAVDIAGLLGDAEPFLVGGAVRVGVGKDDYLVVLKRFQLANVQLRLAAGGQPQVIEELPSNICLMSGGSMMYIDAVCYGIDDIPTVDDETRETMKRRLKEEGLPALVEELRELDPEHYAIVDKQNPRRVVHALEICHMTGKTYTSFRTNTKKERPFRILKIGLNRPREELYNRINQRVDQMMVDGLLEEARRVYDSVTPQESFHSRKKAPSHTGEQMVILPEYPL